MLCYIVAFHTESAISKNKLRERLRTYTAYCPIHDSCWAIKTDQSTANIRDYLTQVINKNDFIFVIRSNTEAVWNSTYSEKNSAWLKENL